MSTASFQYYENAVSAWAHARGITTNGKVETQVMKAGSEMGELFDATIKNQDREFKDAVGDVLVCLINACTLKGTDLTECLALAYEEIKDRKGFLMPNGCFVKE